MHHLIPLFSVSKLQLKNLKNRSSTHCFSAVKLQPKTPKIVAINPQKSQLCILFCCCEITAINPQNRSSVFSYFCCKMAAINPKNTAEKPHKIASYGPSIFCFKIAAIKPQKHCRNGDFLLCFWAENSR